MEDKKIVPVPEVYGWKHNEILQIPVYKSERIEVQDDCDTEKNEKKQQEGRRESWLGQNLQEVVKISLENISTT